MNGMGTGTGASDCQVVEAPWPLYLARNEHAKKKRPIIRRCREAAKKTEKERQGHIVAEVPVTSEPQGRVGTWVQAEVGTRKDNG